MTVGLAERRALSTKQRSELERSLFEALEPVVRSLDLELVEVSVRGSGRRVIRVDIDRPGPLGVGLDDCQRTSRALEAVLDQSDVIPGSYVLEVSSPGADRPIRSADDIRRNTGRRVIVTTNQPIGGSCCHRGVLLGGEDDLLVLEEAGAHRVRIPLDEIVRAVQDLEL